VGSLSPSLDAQRGSVGDGWRQGWEDELFAQQESELLAHTTLESHDQEPTNGKKKKKNKQKITLMATNSQRGA
jgi:hypothetical protein